MTVEQSHFEQFTPTPADFMFSLWFLSDELFLQVMAKEVK
jgi:hypothetical protein